MVERKVRCLNCNREWLSKAAKPRCSRCDSRNVEDVSVETTPPPPPAPPQSGTDYSKVFTAFDEGKSLIDVIKQDLCDPDKALELWNKYEEFKKKTLEIEGRPLLEEKVEEFEDRLAQVEEDLDEILSITNSGEGVKESCEHYRRGYCRRVYWEEKPNVAFSLRKREEDGKWYVDPSPIYCALCTGNTISTLELDILVTAMMDDLSKLKGILMNPPFNIRY
jgi:hypothetical protein